MITHFIFMSSSYSLGTRIALDFIVEEASIKEELKKDLDTIIEECGRDVSISTHYFFKDVKVVEDLETFIKLIQKDRKLQGIDVAKYILAKITCTQLKLQKLVYLCFADYLCDTGKLLFTDKIYAFKYGPVVDTVYKKYKEYGYEAIEEEKGDIDTKDIFEMPSKSRILFAEDGTGKIVSIERTLKKYGDLTAIELVELTHKDDSPWKKTYKDEEAYLEMELDIIKDYHKFEIL